MKTSAKIIALTVFVGLAGYATVASAQYAPPPPPPPPDSGAAPAPPPANTPPPATTPAPYHGRCGVAPSPCAQPPAPVYYNPPPPRRYYRPRFFRLGPYFGAGAGGFGILKAKGPYEFISPGGFGSVWIGMNFGGRLALELGFIGSGHSEEFTGYDASYDIYDANQLFLWGVTLDAKYNLIRPGWRSRFVPYIQAGIGAYGLVGEVYDEWGMSHNRSLASGGGFQLGGGLDIYLARWLVLGARVLYRGIVLGKLECGSGGDRCISDDESQTTYIHGLTGELNLSIVF